nr:MAG TPA: hypothetical protein [Caudoviricetes sp.]
MAFNAFFAKPFETPECLRIFSTSSKSFALSKTFLNLSNFLKSVISDKPLNSSNRSEYSPISFNDCVV